MSEAPEVAVRYLGLSVHKGTKLEQVSPSTAFVAVEKPLPVGTQIELVWQEHSTAARVIRVHEMVAGASQASGMRIAREQGDPAFAAMWSEHASGDDPEFPEPSPGGVVQAVTSGDDTEVVEQPTLEARPSDERKTDIMAAIDIEAIEAEAAAAVAPAVDEPAKPKRKRRARGKKKRD